MASFWKEKPGVLALEQRREQGQLVCVWHTWADCWWSAEGHTFPWGKCLFLTGPEQPGKRGDTRTYCYGKYGPGTFSVGMPWGIARNVKALSSPLAYWLRICILTIAPGESDAHCHLRTWSSPGTRPPSHDCWIGRKGGRQCGILAREGKLEQVTCWWQHRSRGGARWTQTLLRTHWRGQILSCPLSTAQLFSPPASGVPLENPLTPLFSHSDAQDLRGALANSFTARMPFSS